jgi:hypothetical protein
MRICPDLALLASFDPSRFLIGETITPNRYGSLETRPVQNFISQEQLLAGVVCSLRPKLEAFKLSICIPS